jgi:hypothetical protein
LTVKRISIHEKPSLFEGESSQSNFITHIAIMADSTGTGVAVPTLEVSTAVTATDHGQIVVVFAWLSFTAGVMVSAVRMQIRWPSNSVAGKDDLACAVSTVIAFVQTAFILNTVRNGFGRVHTDLGDAQAMGIAKVSTNGGQINLGRESRIVSNFRTRRFHGHPLTFSIEPLCD